MVGDHLVHAPFSDDQVASLNAFQASGVFHPYTGSDGGDVLVADRAGLRSLRDPGRLQTWAHAFTADWSWRGEVIARR